MYKSPPGYETVFTSANRDACMESRLVLVAINIPVELVHENKQWLLIVEQGLLSQAAAELDGYWKENTAQTSDRKLAAPIYTGAYTGAAIFSVVVILAASLSLQGALGIDYFESGEMHAGKVVAGQWWRTVTALTLHVDIGHVIANLLFGTLFGFLAGRVLGGGVAWLSILIAGSVGNSIDALARPPDFVSVGSSTAVFAALGIIVVNALQPSVRSNDNLLKRWSPLIGGILLFSLTGIGDERTDVVAHTSGFAAGLLLGWFGCKMPRSWLASQAVQRWAGWAAIAILLIAWVTAITLF